MRLERHEWRKEHVEKSLSRADEHAHVLPSFPAKRKRTMTTKDSCVNTAWKHFLFPFSFCQTQEGGSCKGTTVVMFPDNVLFQRNSSREVEDMKAKRKVTDVPMRVKHNAPDFKKKKKKTVISHIQNWWAFHQGSLHEMQTTSATSTPNDVSFNSCGLFRLQYKRS